MELSDIVSLFTNASVTIIVIAFFMYRDLKFTSTLQNTLQALVDTVITIKEMVEKKGSEY